MLGLSGCARTQVVTTKQAPDPYFFSCKTIDWFIAAKAPDYVIDDAVRTTNIMLKLQTLQLEVDREKLGACPASTATVITRKS